jgi:hypothetical protein
LHSTGPNKKWATDVKRDFFLARTQLQMLIVINIEGWRVPLSLPSLSVQLAPDSPTLPLLSSTGAAGQSGGGEGLGASLHLVDMVFESLLYSR